MDYSPEDNEKKAVEFLEQLRPGGPWVLTAIVPDGPVRTITATSGEEVLAFIRSNNSKRNLYYSANPTRTALNKKAKKADIAAIEFLLADLDPAENESAEAAKARYLGQLEKFEPAPTAIVDSGNGIQCLWRLAEPIKPSETTIADAEARSKALMERLGSAAGTQNIDRVLRLPGTINLPNAKKQRDGRVACPTALIKFNGATSRLEDFPLPETKTGAEEQPRARERGALPPMVAALLLLKDNGPYASRSELLFAFITSALRAKVNDETIISSCLNEQPGCGIYDHCEENGGQAYIERQIDRARKASSTVTLDPNDPMRSAREYVASNLIREEMQTLYRHRGAFWHWTGSHFHLADDETIRAGIWAFLENARRLEKRKSVPFKPNRDRVGNVLDALAAATQLDKYIEPPVWLAGGDTMPPADEFFACGNGLLHLPTGKTYSPTPNYFGLSASEVSFDPNAPEPREWLVFLTQLWGDDQETINALQEFCGYALAADTSQQKILLMVGPRRSGKGTIARVMRKLLGQTSVAGPTMSSLSETFGLEPLIPKPLAIISDARIGQRTDKSMIVERLLSISGEDQQTVARKFKDAWHGQLRTRFLIISNELPSLSDGSGALAGRYIVLVLTKSFFGMEDLTLTPRLWGELSGILNWAIEGYRRLQERGHFIQPQSSVDAVEDIEMLAAPVKAFIRDRCRTGPGLTVSIDALWEAWRAWCMHQGQANHGIKAWFGRNLRSAVPGIATRKGGTRDDREQEYVGIELVHPNSETPF